MTNIRVTACHTWWFNVFCLVWVFVCVYPWTEKKAAKDWTIKKVRIPTAKNLLNISYLDNNIAFDAAHKCYRFMQILGWQYHPCRNATVDRSSSLPISCVGHNRTDTLFPCRSRSTHRNHNKTRELNDAQHPNFALSISISDFYICALLDFGTAGWCQLCAPLVLNECINHVKQYRKWFDAPLRIRGVNGMR